MSFLMPFVVVLCALLTVIGLAVSLVSIPWQGLLLLLLLGLLLTQQPRTGSQTTLLEFLSLNFSKVLSWCFRPFLRLFLKPDERSPQSSLSPKSDTVLHYRGATYTIQAPQRR